VPSDNIPPGFLEGANIEKTTYFITILHEIDPRPDMGEGMEQHAYLHRSERIKILQIIMRDFDALEFFLVQVGQGERRLRGLIHTPCKGFIRANCDARRLAVGY